MLLPSLMPRMSQSSLEWRRLTAWSGRKASVEPVSGFASASGRTRRKAFETLRRLLPVGWRYTTNPVLDFLFSYIEGGPETRPGVKRFNILYLGMRKTGADAGTEGDCRHL